MKINEVVYYCLDAIKSFSDDSYVNEDHIKWLLGKYRGALLQQYHNIKKTIPESNYQTICVNLQPEKMGLCSKGYFLKSTTKVPSMLTVGSPSVLLNNWMESENIVFVPFSRLKNVGYNKWKQNFIYAAIGPDNYFYLSSNNPQTQYLEKIKLKGIFENYEEAAELDCDENGNSCDIMEKEFPLEVSVMPDLLARVVKDVLGVAWRMTDQRNNASDDLADISNFIRQNMKSKYQKELEGEE